MVKLKILLIVSLLAGSCSSQPTYPEPPRQGDTVTVDVHALQTEVPVFFTYHHKGKKINFLVVRVDNRVLSFLDACARCYPAKKGYRFENGTLICRECNVSYSVTAAEKGAGSCVPIMIAGSLEKGRYLIPLSVLEGMADKF